MILNRLQGNRWKHSNLFVFMTISNHKSQYEHTHTHKTKSCILYHYDGNPL